MPTRVVTPVLAATLIDCPGAIGIASVAPNRLFSCRSLGEPPSEVALPPRYQVASKASHALDVKV